MTDQKSAIWHPIILLLFGVNIALSQPDLWQRANASLGAGGQITFQATVGGQELLWRLNAELGAVPENLSARLDSIASPLLPGTHEGPIKVSPDGAWYVFLSERFDQDSQGWPGLTIARADFSLAETIRVNGQTIHGEGGQATSNGTAVAYEDAGGPHARDLFIVERQGATWAPPRLLTGDSPYAYNSWHVLSPDNQRVVFDAGNEPYGGPGTRICEVRVDGTGFQELVSPISAPPGYQTSPTVACHSPAYALDGSVVFEGQWGETAG